MAPVMPEVRREFSSTGLFTGSLATIAMPSGGLRLMMLVFVVDALCGPGTLLVETVDI